MPDKIATIEQHGAVTSIYTNLQSNTELWTLNVADVHFDSVYCNRELMRSQFDEAARRNARINIYGDWFDAMQGRYDKRREYPLLRKEYKREDYYDFVVKDSVEWLKPYAHLLDICADGNHELSVLKHANTNLMDRLVYGLHTETENCTAVHGGYGGWVRYMFSLGLEPRSGTQKGIKVKYFHGAGGEAPVTRGVIQTNRQAVYLPDADIVFNGHSHNSYYVPIVRERIGNKGTLHMDIQHHIRIPGFMQSYGDGSTGWEVTRGGVPKPIGSIWVKFTTNCKEIKIQVIPDIIAAEVVSL